MNKLHSIEYFKFWGVNIITFPYKPFKKSTILFSSYKQHETCPIYKGYQRKIEPQPVKL